jgi:hypothetical protein
MLIDTENKHLHPQERAQLLAIGARLTRLGNYEPVAPLKAQSWIVPTYQVLAPGYKESVDQALGSDNSLSDEAQGLES